MSRMDLVGVQSPQMDWESENLPERWKRFDNMLNSCLGVLSQLRRRKKIVVTC